MLALLLFTCFLWQGGGTSSPLSRSTIAAPSSSSADYLLPTNVQPEQYFIEFEPDFEKDTFNGSVRIDFVVLDATREFYFHRKDLNISAGTIVLLGENGAVASSVFGFSCVNDDKEICTIIFSDELVTGRRYTLIIGQFYGTLHLDNYGFYLAKYTDEQGNEVKFGTTQFEPTSARRAFPCLDEPALKAHFTLSIIRPQNYSSISNTNPVTIGEKVTDGRYRDTFNTTVKMSTYLIAFIVSTLDHTEKLERNTVYARPEEIKQGNGQYALEIGEKILKSIEEFLSVNYSLNKMDQAAIPNDYFASGAMENWGLVTYREVYLLYSANTSLLSQKQTITTIIAHEFGHQWFGNLVSPEWWTYIWLNEGFATYFEYYAASIVQPTWDLMDQFVVKTLQYAFGPDSLITTRAINTDAGSPKDISALFDRVAYEKSGSVIRMFETFLTTDVFRKGLNKYLNARAYQAANPSHLYSALQEALDESALQGLLPENKTVSDVLSTWDTNVGYPVVEVERNYSSYEVKFSQSRFLLKNSTKDNSSIWYIPINYAIEEDNSFDNLSTNFWLTGVESTVLIGDLHSSRWIIVNKQERGYYRVNYDEDNWKLIINYLNSENYDKIPRINRAQLLDDSFNLARSGRLDYQHPLELAQYLSRETDYIPLYSFFQSLSFIDTALASSEEYATLKNFVVGLLEAAYEHLGTAEKGTDSHLDTLNRVNVLTWLCRYGHKGCRDVAHTQLHQWESGNIITPNLQSVYFCGASYEADRHHWEFLYSKLAELKESSIRTRLINGLGCSENEEILETYLNIAVNTSNTGLSSTERQLVFSSVINSGIIGRKFVTKYIRENNATVKAAVNLQSIVSSLGAKVTTEEQMDELLYVIWDNNLNESLLDTAKENIEWSKKYLNPVERWFVTKRNSSSRVSTGIALVFIAFVARFVF